MPRLPTTGPEAFARGGGGPGTPSSRGESGGSGGQNTTAERITTGGPDSRGPHADIRDTDLSEWNRVTVDGDLKAAIDEHGSRTVYRIDGTAHLREQCNAGGRVVIVGGTVELHGSFGVGLRFGSGGDRASGVVLADCTIDVSDARFDAGLISIFAAGDGALVRDVDVVGRIHGPGNGLSCTTTPGAVVECERLSLADGSERDAGTGSSADDSVGVIMSGASDGVLRLHGCEIGPMPNNGVYASGPAKHGGDGHAIITDHTGWGSDRDQLRVGGESIIDGAELWVDTLRDGYDNARGVWSRYARGVTIRNVSFRSHHSDAGEGVRIDSTAGRTVIEDCDLEMRSSHKAARGVMAYAPGPNAGDDHRVVIRDTRIHGAGSPRDGVLILSRPRVFENLDVDLPNAGEAVDVR